MTAHAAIEILPQPQPLTPAHAARRTTTILLLEVPCHMALAGSSVRALLTPPWLQRLVGQTSAMLGGPPQVRRGRVRVL